ncbi:MAG: sulfatase-like hydrolase/transferase [Fuerstiella sp.]|nr:sulfatase-like hydrolase/transferase [Fuerstiella sp.]MCP4859130.1 sulfatase-like hydrolase/transferase [Fuerstiella sp.]
MNNQFRRPIVMQSRIILIIPLLIPGVLASRVAAADPPNILFILTDDQRDDSFSGMGHAWVRTPNIDGLLARGTRFQNAYIAEPTCRPSRAAIFLGCHERVNRMGFSSTAKLIPSQWKDSYVALLKNAGYHTGYVGKWHVLRQGFSIESLFDFCEAHDGHGQFYFDVEDPSGTKRTITTNRKKTDDAIRYLDSRPTDKPFCLSICYATPHGSKVRMMHKRVAESASLNPKLKGHPIYGGMYRDLDIAHPLQQTQNPYSHIPRDVMDQDKGRNKTYSYDYDLASNKEHHYRYYQMVTEIDQMVGELVDMLKKRGLDRNTVLVFASDHGVLMGEYGMGGKGLLYDLAEKIPCFIYDPRAAKDTRGQVRSELVSSLDITTTLLDYAGVEKSPFMDGRSLKPLVQSTSPAKSWREGLFLENLYVGRDTPLQEGYVEEDWKYIRMYKPARHYTDADLVHKGDEPVFEMLFNLKSDQGETKNLASSPEVKEIKARLQAMCQREVDRLNRARVDYQSQYLAQ